MKDLLRKVLAIFSSRQEEIKPVIIKIKIKCPKCKCSDVTIDEILEGSKRRYYSEAGEINLNDYNKFDGEPTRLESECGECYHRWTIRNKVLISDIDVTDRTPL